MSTIGASSRQRPIGAASASVPISRGRSAAISAAIQPPIDSPTT
jgi:hypothetical protein